MSSPMQDCKVWQGKEYLGHDKDEEISSVKLVMVE